MRFTVSSAFQPLDQLVEIARAADELGYHAISLPDNVVDLEELSTPYPYTEDGTRRWDIGAPWADPWVAIGAMSAVTTRLRFFTSVYIAALRSPFQVAKSVATAAVPLPSALVSAGAATSTRRRSISRSFGRASTTSSGPRSSPPAREGHPPR